MSAVGIDQLVMQAVDLIDDGTDVAMEHNPEYVRGICELIANVTSAEDGYVHLKIEAGIAERRLTKTPILFWSFHEPEGSGGFYWDYDTPTNRLAYVGGGKRDAKDYRDVIVVACSIRVEADDAATTDLLDRHLVFESGRVGKILYRSPRFVTEIDN